jgi:cysteine desulfurase
MPIKYYFDYAATTPLDPRVLRAMKPYFSQKFGNPGSIHETGRKAKEAIEKAAAKIASILHCRPQEFIFTGSATEADNLAVLGIAKANAIRDFEHSSNNPTSQAVPNEAIKTLRNKIIISAVEHKAILASCQALAEEGFEIVKLKVDKNGLVDPNDVAKLLDSKTILVSIIYADNETGTIQPIKEIAKVIKKFRASHNSSLPYFHTDASQAAQYLDINVERLGVDLMTVSSHKLYGPKGIGGLYIRKGVRIKPIIFGGGQQNNIRSGTENVPSIVGFAEALALAESNKQKEYKRLEKLRNELEQGIFKLIPKVVLNGHPQKRLPNFLNVSILDIEGEAALLYLDQKGICASTGSACDSQSLEPSHVILALGRPYEYAHGSLRFTLGKYTTRESIQYLLKHLPPIVEKLRQMSPVNIKIGEEKKISLPQAFVGGKTPHFLKKN